MGGGFGDEARRAVARWAMGEIDGDAALAAICSAVERPGTTWACARDTADGGREVVLTERGSAAKSLVARVVRETWAQRAYVTSREPRFADLLGGGGDGGASWIACEPLVVDGEPCGAVVVVGAEPETSDDVLASLPEVARACCPVIARERTVVRVGKLVHAMNNVLAAVIANVEYASGIVEDASAAEASDLQRRDLLRAMENARTAAGEMSTTLREIARIARGA